MVYVVFKEDRSIIRPRKIKNGGFQFNLPQGAKVAVLGIKVENGRPQMAQLNTSLQVGNDIVLDYETVTLKEMRKQLEALRG